MSKKSRGTTGDANKRRESHTRKVWGEAIPSKAAHWFDHRTKGKRRDELEQRSLAKLRRLEPVHRAHVHPDGTVVLPDCAVMTKLY